MFTACAIVFLFFCSWRNIDNLYLISNRIYCLREPCLHCSFQAFIVLMDEILETFAINERQTESFRWTMLMNRKKTVITWLASFASFCSYASFKLQSMSLFGPRKIDIRCNIEEAESMYNIYEAKASDRAYIADCRWGDAIQKQVLQHCKQIKNSLQQIWAVVNMPWKLIVDFWWGCGSWTVEINWCVTQSSQTLEAIKWKIS